MKINYTLVREAEEKYFLKMLDAYSVKAETQQKNFFTPFYQEDWMREVIQKYIGLEQLPEVRFFGGYTEAERKVLGFMTQEIKKEDLPITALKIEVKTGIGKSLSHRDFLGALLGLGIHRSKIGDIMIKPFGAYTIVSTDIAEFIGWSLTSIGRYGKLTVEEVDLETIEIDRPETKRIETTVASLRADALFAVAFNLSRTSVAKLLQNDKGKCNGMNVAASTLLKEGDRGVLRGYGKMKLTAVHNRTKKDRLHVTIEKYI